MVRIPSKLEENRLIHFVCFPLSSLPASKSTHLIFIQNKCRQYFPVIPSQIHEINLFPAILHDLPFAKLVSNGYARIWPTATPLIG